jgi:hypothetical protein
MSTPINIVGGIRFKPHTPRGTQFVNLHEDFPKEVNIVFVGQPLDRGGGDLDPPGLVRPPRYFGLSMVHPSQPPLPPNRPYHRPLNYPKYVKDSNAHVKVFKATIKANSEIDDAKIINLFIFTFKNTMSNWCNNYLGDYPNCTFVELQLACCKRYIKDQNDEQVYLQLKNMKQEKNERMEVYYERLLKLANSLKHKTTDSLLTIIFKSGL